MTAFRFAALAAAAGLALPAGPSAAQENTWAPGRRFDESSNRVLSSIERITAKTNYGYVNGICFLSGHFQKGQELQFYRDFEGGVKYAVVGGGDNGTRNLDVFILDADGKVVVQDTLEDNIPIVEFTPPRNARYTIKMVLQDGGPAGGMGSLGILRKGGYEVPAKNQVIAFSGLIDEANKVDREVPEVVEFSRGPAQWGVYGAIIPSGADVAISGITPGGGKRYWVCGADQTTKDVDLYLYDQTGRLLKKDERVDPPLPRLDFRTNPDESYTVRVKNVQSSRPSLILVGTLALE
ncbi:hypothetical protein J0H58_17210 [bacterium]|nr:hypothetical protein [bacterium]